MTVKGLRKSRFSRVIARACCALLLMPQLLAWTTRPAVAQQRDNTVIVIDFNNLTNVGGPLLGRNAAAAMALQLRQSDVWDPVNQNDVLTKIAELRLTPPFDRVELQTLARSLDATAVLTGDVIAARVTQNPAQAEVQIVVRLMDVASGEPINGASARGTASHIGLDGAQDVLLDEALSKAAFEARVKMERYQLAEGTILNTSVTGDRQDALLNIGTRQGVQTRMQFVVLRGSEVVGYLSARTVDPDKTVATIVRNFRGVKPEDRVRAVFEFTEGDVISPAVSPTDPGLVVEPGATPTPKKSKKSLTGAARVLGGLLLALGIYALAGRKSGTTDPFSTTAQATSLGAADPATAAAIRVTWKRPREVPPNAIVQYQVYRVDLFNPAVPTLIGIASEANREVFDTAAGGTVNNYYPGVAGPGVRGDAGAVVTTAVTFPGIVPGRQYRYFVQTVYLPGVTFDTGDGTGGGTGNGGTGAVADEFLISAPSRASGQVTPLAPPATTSPADQATGVDLNNVTFTWTTVAGADLYSVQVSADPANPNSYQEVTRYQNPSRTGGQSVSRTVNIANRFAGRTLLAWRVGARNTADPAAPVGGYVFSNIASFTPQQ